MRTIHVTFAAIFVLAIGVISYSLRGSQPVIPVTTVSTAPLPQSIPIQSTSSHVAPPELYPNPQLTSGKADTLLLADLTATYSDHCPNSETSCTYSQDHRNVPTAEHTQVYDEYRVPSAERTIQSGEVDHFYPLCAGGSNDISNLWYQPVDVEWNGENWGFHRKDDLETWVCAQIKAGKLDPQEAFKKMTTDWVAFYEEVKPPHTNFSN